MTQALPLDRIPNRKEQIVASAIARIFAGGFEGFRIRDVARDVGINNATLLHHFPSKEALIRAVVEQFAATFVVADANNLGGSANERLSRHVRAGAALMRTSPEIFAVLNEIMVRARRDDDVMRLLEPMLRSWRDHIVSLQITDWATASKEERRKAKQLATVCMMQMVGLSMMSGATNSSHLGSDFDLDAMTLKTCEYLSNYQNN